MAQTTPFLSARRAVIALKIEETPGTAATLASSDTGIDARDVSLTPTIEKEPVAGNGLVDPQASQTGRKFADLTFTTYLRNSPLVRALLQGCGLTMSGTGPYTFTPVTLTGTDFGQTLTVAVYESGYRRVIWGAMGSLTISGQPGRVPTLTARLLGKYDEGDVSAITPTVESPSRGPAWSGYSTTLQSIGMRLASFTFNQNNELFLRDDESEATGILQTFVTGRGDGATVDLDPEAVLAATHPWYTRMINSTAMALSLPVGDGSGSTVLAAPAAELRSKNRGNRNNVLIDEMNLVLTGQADGTAAYTLTLS